MSPLLGDAYAADCNLYCIECDCPGSEYCQQTGASIKEVRGGQAGGGRVGGAEAARSPLASTGASP